MQIRKAAAAERAKAKAHSMSSEEDAAASAGEAEEEGQVNVAQERDAIRRGYRSLIQTTLESRPELIVPGCQEFVQILDKGDALFERVKKLDSKAPETVLDSEFLGLASQVAVEQVTQLSTGFRCYTIGDYLDKVKAITDGEDGEPNYAGWDEFFDNQVHPYLSSTPGRLFMYGVLNKDEPKKKQRKEREKSELAKKTKPTQVEKTDETEEAEMTKRVVHVSNALKESTTKKMNHSLLEFCVDQESFSRTVENLFHFSFLLKDGHAKTQVVDNKMVVTASAPPYEHDYASGAAKMHQSIVRLDFNSFGTLSQNIPTFIEPLVDAGATGSAPGGASQPTNGSKKSSQPMKQTKLALSKGGSPKGGSSQGSSQTNNKKQQNNNSSPPKNGQKKNLKRKQPSTSSEDGDGDGEEDMIDSSEEIPPPPPAKKRKGGR